MSKGNFFAQFPHAFQYAKDADAMADQFRGSLSSTRPGPMSNADVVQDGIRQTIDGLFGDQGFLTKRSRLDAVFSRFVMAGCASGETITDRDLPKIWSDFLKFRQVDEENVKGILIDFAIDQGKLPEKFAEKVFSEVKLEAQLPKEYEAIRRMCLALFQVFCNTEYPSRVLFEKEYVAWTNELHNAVHPVPKIPQVAPAVVMAGSISIDCSRVVDAVNAPKTREAGGNPAPTLFMLVESNAGMVLKPVVVVAAPPVLSITEVSGEMMKNQILEPFPQNRVAELGKSNPTQREMSHRSSVFRDNRKDNPNQPVAKTDEFAVAEAPDKERRYDKLDESEDEVVYHNYPRRHVFNPGASGV